VIPSLPERIEVTQLSDRILEILRSCPRGLTANEVAEQLGAASGNISSRLSKLAAYGVIEKTRGGVAVRFIYNVPTSLPSTQRLTAA
jgi:predicted transcriptional regulator